MAEACFQEELGAEVHHSVYSTELLPELQACSYHNAPSVDSKERFELLALRISRLNHDRLHFLSYFCFFGF